MPSSKNNFSIAVPIISRGKSTTMDIAEANRLADIIELRLDLICAFEHGEIS